VTELKWIESGKNKATLNAPKGMAFQGDNLYVADIDTVRIFDRKTGAPAGEVKIPGASFLNDVAATSDGRVLVSDTGVDGKDFSAKGTDAIWAIEAKTKKATPLVKAKELEGPNGILVQGEKIWVVSFGGASLYQIDAKAGKKGDAKAMPKGKLDGIVAAGDEILVSSWESSTVYRGKPDGTFTAFVENVEAPADLGFDTKRSRVLVPMFNGNEVRAYDVTK
jgi:sugar lactone lactonase YvrE